MKAAKFTPLTVSGKLSVCDAYYIEQDSKYSGVGKWVVIYVIRYMDYGVKA